VSNIFETLNRKVQDKQRNDQRTRDVAARGAQALQARRTASSYGRTESDQALDALLQGVGGGQNQIAQDWQQSRFGGVGSQPVVLGQGDGKYAGFETQGMLQAAILGRAEMLREQDRQMAGEYGAQADQFYGQVGDIYGESLNKALDSLVGTVETTNPRNADGLLSGSPQMAYGTRKQEVDSNPYFDYLADWQNEARDPYVQALEAAQQIEQTPLREYGMLAGAEYGVDPNVVGGWYPEADQLADYDEQRDLEAIDLYGMPYDELQAYQQDQLDAEDAAMSADQDAYEAALDETVGSLGFDPGYLQQETDLTNEQIVSVMQDEVFQQLDAEVAAAFEQDGDEDKIKAAVGKALNAVYETALAYDPAVARLLDVKWSDYYIPPASNSRGG
jgi:hypothetical protein